jgi:hypothetical protein
MTPSRGTQNPCDSESAAAPSLQWRLQRGESAAICVMSTLMDGQVALDMLIGKDQVVTELFLDAAEAAEASERRREQLEREDWTA